MIILFIREGLPGKLTIFAPILCGCFCKTAKEATLNCIRLAAVSVTMTGHGVGVNGLGQLCRDWAVSPFFFAALRNICIGNGVQINVIFGISRQRRDEEAEEDDGG